MDTKGTVAAVGVLGAALVTGATLIATRKAEAPPPPSAGCQFTLVAQDVDGTEHFPTNAGQLCPDRVTFDGKTYWMAQEDFQRRRLVYRQHVATKPAPPPAPPQPPLAKAAPRARPSVLDSNHATHDRRP
jgi:hypothetical protein